MFNFASTVWYCVWANAYVICTTVLTRFKTIFYIPTITGTKNISLPPNFSYEIPCNNILFSLSLTERTARCKPKTTSRTKLRWVLPS